MRYPGLAILLAALCAPARPAAGQSAAPGPSARDGAVHGVVKDQTTDSAVAGAHVLLAGTPLRTTTDQRGEFVFVGLAPGPYRVRVLSIGFAALAAGVTVLPGTTVELTLALARVDLQLAGITVTASGSAQKVGESAVSVAVMEHDEILEHNTIQVQDALPFVSGIDMNHGEVDIRGASGVSEGVGSRVLMLLDGHPVLTGDGGEIDYEALPVLDLARVEVVKGSQSALYGSAAMGGVVNLITTPIDERPATAVKLHYGVYDVPDAYRFAGGRPDYSGFDLQHSRRVGSVGLRLALSGEESAGYHQNGRYDRWLLRGKIGSMAGSPHPWDAYLILSDLDQGQFTGWLSPEQPYQVVDTALGDWNHNVHVLVGGQYTALAGSRAMLRLEPSVTYTAVRDHMHDSNNWHNAARSALNTLLTFNPGSAHAVTAGLDVAGTALSSSYYPKKWITDAAPYAQEEWALAPALKATAGVRLDYHHVDGGQAEETVNPKLGLSYSPAGPVALRASFGRGYRAPSAIEQFVATQQQGVRVLPNPSLHGETAWSGEVGGSASLGRLWLDAAVFQSWYHGLIGPGTVPGQFLAFSFQNVERATVRGLDGTAKVSVVPHRADLTLSYMYLDTRDDSTGMPLPYRSRHTATASLDLLSGLVGVDVRYRSRLEQVLEYPLDPRSDVTVVDLRLATRVSGIAMLVRVSNLLQERYVDVMERNQGAPRSLLVTAITTF